MSPPKLIGPKTIGFEIKSLGNLITRCLHESAARSGLAGLTGVQGWIIGYLYAHRDGPDIFQRDLEKAFKIRRSTATGLLQAMERKGFITREPVGYDGRLKRLRLTPKAITHHELILEKIQEVEERLRRGLSEEEVNTFYQLMEKLKRNLEKVDP
ncbi:MAG TPA: MarR family winged helix-turn-helix transcriptional regulator [Capillibacterium sp.]